MKIINLIENTEGREGCAYAHGLSFYVETEKHRLLMDLGPSGETVRNAETLGIDLPAIDTVILSHGHYDHADGIVPFSKINNTAAIYMQKGAGDDYFADEGPGFPGRYKYIGIEKSIADLPQVRWIQGDYQIDDELELFTIRERSRELPFANKSLLIRTGDGYRRDDFAHEQFLVVRQGGQSVLISGCAHNGILSIMDAYRDKYGSDPDLVISGFHLMKKSAYSRDEIREIEEIARELCRSSSRFVTCHCTSIPAYDVMKEIMGDQLGYVHSGECVS